MVVLKFGGSSVETIAKMEIVAERIIERVKKEEEVVVVVSAMGKTTNNLFSLARQITKYPVKRELDLLLATGEMTSIALLSMILNAKGYKSISLTASQARIYSIGEHTCSHIKNIDTSVISSYLNAGYIVIVAGYQGVNEKGDITTLGREGSDTSAVNLAYYLKCPCEIYSDVKGIYFVDPRIYQNEIIHQELSYYEMLLLSLHGAKVLATSAITFASLKKVPLRLASTYSPSFPGTLIKDNNLVTYKDLAGIAILNNIRLIKVKGGLDYEEIKKLQSLGVKVDNIDLELFALACDDILFLEEALCEVLGSKFVSVNKNMEITKVSIIGKKCNDDDFVSILVEKIKKQFKIINFKHITNRLSIFINKEIQSELVRFLMENIIAR